MGLLRIGVLGPGGVGGLIAALAARAGAEVTCVAPQPTVNVLRERGILIASARFGDFRQPLAATNELVTPVDVLCVAVKATMLEEALQSVHKDVLDGALVVPFLNGVEHVAMLRRRLAPARVIAATIKIESTRVAPGQIEHASPFAEIELALNPPFGEVADQFVNLLSTAGFDVIVRGDELGILWEKLAFIGPCALMTTAYRAPVGEIRAVHRDELAQVVREVAEVAASAGVTIDAANVLSRFDMIPGTMRSSMERDAAAGRAIEIEAIGGSLIRTADRASLAAPALRNVVERVRSMVVAAHS